ncbi:MAG: fumarate hydratase [Synergistetes bacterium]|nr:fumarate hydratase [Synergistota bacterium]
MGSITPEFLREEISRLLREKCCVTIAPDAKLLLKQAYDRETSPAAKNILETQIKNVEMAEKLKKPVCQSPGYGTIYVRFGKCADIDGLKTILSEEISNATRDGFLRPSMVHPITRKNTNDNSGVGIPNMELFYEPDLEFIDIIVSFKGCGSELGNAVKIFTPAQIGKNAEGIKEFILDTVIKAGAKPCPPIALGIGIGGQMDVAARLSRKAVSVREWTDRNPDPYLADMEEELLSSINKLGIGAGGVGGKTTALAVKIEMAYTHTAICPVAVNFHCWVARRSGIRIYPDCTVEYLFKEKEGE